MGNGTKSQSRGRRDEGASALQAGGGPTGIVSFRRGGRLWTEARTGERPRAGDGEIPRPALHSGWQRCRLRLLPRPARPRRRGEREAGARAGAREGGRREGPGAPVTGWQPRSGLVAAAAAPPPPPAAPLAAATTTAAAAAAAGRSFTPDPRSEPWPRVEREPGRQLQPATVEASWVLRPPASVGA
ncbi:hypothetical protein P7K49_005191 [Saguinus oedipus]|uniref:Uncharacterized protein n=1 Tax=Saguinus oedipus TaxID=9490 RepID=A0ABQ9W9K3_SAGOE|nr:hypothetical protein P7K49_005191 [Saguinus oedipus]